MNKAILDALRAAWLNGSLPEDVEGVGIAEVREWSDGEPRVERARASKPLKTDARRRSITYVWSDETPDRMGDIVLASGGDFTEYAKNPIALFGHRSSDMRSVIGNGCDPRVEKVDGKQAVVGEIEFAPLAASEDADRAYRLASVHSLESGETVGPFLRATSIGFISRERVIVEDEEERTKLGLGRWGVIFKRWALHEISVVPVPANPNAVALALRALVEAKAITSTDADWALRRSLGDAPIIDLRTELQKVLDKDLAMTRLEAEVRALTKQVGEMHLRVEQIGAGAKATQVVVAEPVPVVDISAQVVNRILAGFEQQQLTQRITDAVVKGI